MEKEKLKNTDNGDFILKRKEYLHFFCFNLLLFLSTYFAFIFLSTMALMTIL